MGDIRFAFFMNLAFTLIEIVGGLLTNSVAILSDAVHDLGDTISLGMAWFLGGVAQKGSNQRYTYGYRRYSLVAALLNAVILVGGSLFILSQAIPRLLEPQPFDAVGMTGSQFLIYAMGLLKAERKTGLCSISLSKYIY